MKFLIKLLIVGSTLFFAETAFEMYFLTLLNGQQMLFFSLAHIAPGAIWVVVLSGIAFICLAICISVIILLNFLGVMNSEQNYIKVISIIFIIQLVHTVLLLTYDFWAGALFKNGGII